MVSGGAGFIGSHLCDRLLAEGHTVVAVDDLSTGRIANLAEARGYGQKFTFFNLDVRSDGIMQLFERHEPEVVMHLAAQSSVAVSAQDPALDADINIMGLVNVLECAARSDARKVVFAASGGTLYGEARKFPLKETSAAKSRPVSPYGISKKAAIEYLDFYGRFRGLDWTALALGNVYGPRQDPSGEAGVVAIFAQSMLAGESPTIFGDGNQTRDYVFVDDAVHAFALAIGAGDGKLLNIGTGVETSVNRIYKLVADRVGFLHEPEMGPPRPGDLRRCALDSEAAAKAIGWKPWTHVEDGIAETVAFLRGV